MPSSAIVIEDDEDTPASSPLNIDIQVSTSFQSSGATFLTHSRLDRPGTSVSRVSKKGKIQKPNRQGGSIMIGEEYHDSVVNVLKRQVFVHISSELDRYEGILGRSACTNIGTKIAGMLTEEPGFVDDLVENEWKLSKSYEQRIAARARVFVIQHVTHALTDLKIRRKSNANALPEGLDPIPKAEAELIRQPLGNLNGLDHEAFTKEQDFKMDPSPIQIDSSDERSQQSNECYVSAVSQSGNVVSSESAEHGIQSHKTTANRSKFLSNHQSRELRQRHSVVYRLAAKRKSYTRRTTSGISPENLQDHTGVRPQTPDFGTLHKIQLFQLAGLDAAMERPYLKADDRELIRRGLEAMRSGPISRIFSAKNRELLESSPLHVDLCAEELDTICSLLNSLSPDKEARYLSSRRRVMALMQGRKSDIDGLALFVKTALGGSCKDTGSRLLQSRSLDSIRAFLQDASTGHIPLESQVLRITSKTKSKPAPSCDMLSISALLRQREVFGSSSVRLSRGQRSFNSTISNYFEDSLVYRSEWIDCCGDIAAVSWVTDSTFVCGALAHSDLHNMQYNKPGNLLVGNTCTDTLKSVADHRIPRPLVSSGENVANSLDAMRQTQDSWLYTSVVSTAHCNISGYTFTASFDKTVKVWQICESDSSMELQGTWKHDSKVNFVVTSERHSLVATASDSCSQAIRVYYLDIDDISNSAYQTYTGDRANERSQEMRPGDKWAYYPATIQWGRSDSVASFLAVGYSPRSVTGNDNDIPDDKVNTGELCIWDVGTGLRVPFHAARTQNVFEIIWHPSQPMLLAATSPAGPCESDTKTQIRIFALNEVGAFLQIKSLDCPAIDVNELTIRPLGLVDCYVTASCTDGATYVWDTAQGDDAIHVLRHGEPLETQVDDVPREVWDSGVTFAAWGKGPGRFYTGSSDGVVKAWDIQAPRGKTFIRDVISVSGGISVGAFSSDYSKLILGDESGKVYLLEPTYGEDAVDISSRADTALCEGAARNLDEVNRTRRRPKLIIPHPEPEPPWTTSGMIRNIETSGRELARAFLEEGQLILHPDGETGPVQGPNYHETQLYRKDCHEDGDENKPLLPVFQEKQREEVSKQRRALSIPRLPTVRGSNKSKHENNVALDLKMSGLSLECRETLIQDGVDLDFEEGYRYSMELTPSSKIFKRRRAR